MFEPLLGGFDTIASHMFLEQMGLVFFPGEGGTEAKRVLWSDKLVGDMHVALGRGICEVDHGHASFGLVHHCPVLYASEPAICPRLHR